MWQEYYKQHPDGLKSSQFCEHYLRWSKKVNPVMHMNHKAGDKMFVDYAGKTLQILDKDSGEITQVQFFVAILGASQYTYAEASPSQQKEDFIKSVENALHYFKGVPSAIVPDNLKAAVTKSSRYEPVINESFLDFAEHYATAILPARAYKPRDKSLAEGAVRILYQRIYTKINKEIFYDIKQLNQAIWKELELHNNLNLTGRNCSRKQLFDEVEAHKLSPLPLHRYEVRQISHSTVILNGHVLLSKDKHYYSVPYQYIRKKVKIMYTSDTVEIFYRYNRIASHKRNLQPYNYTTVKEHLASEHQFVSDWTPQRFINWAASIGDDVKVFISRLLEVKPHPELTNACRRAVEYNIYNYKIIQNILEKGLDQLSSENMDENQLSLPGHDNIRGDQYYK